MSRVIIVLDLTFNLIYQTVSNPSSSISNNDLSMFRFFP